MSLYGRTQKVLTLIDDGGDIDGVETSGGILNETELKCRKTEKGENVTRSTFIFVVEEIQRKRMYE